MPDQIVIPAQPAKRSFSCASTEGFAHVLHALGASLLVTTYQAGKVIVVRAVGDRLSILLRSFQRAMGLALNERELALGTRNRVWLFDRMATAPFRASADGTFDACFIPRRCHVTGNIDGHELAWLGEQLWLVNTRFSCLCTLDPHYSFVPRWQPPFISRLIAEDRCHLNGLATADGSVRYVTALGATDSPQGWRDQRVRGGVVIDVASGEIAAAELCLPHSPRLHEGRLWLLNSGRGQLLTLDVTRGPDAAKDVVQELPGYTRGLAMSGPYALVGLSRVRSSRTFAGLPLCERVAQPQCGVWAIDLRSGEVIAQLEFLSGVSEIFDVQLVQEARLATLVGLEQNTINRTFSMPPDGGSALL